MVLADYHTQRARQLARRGLDREAVDACNSAAALQNNCAEALALRGQALLRLEDCAGASTSFDRYLDLRGRPLADVYRGRGQARMKLCRFLDAAEDYSRALELAMESRELGALVGLGGAAGLRVSEADLLAHRGWAWFFSNAFEPALRDFDRAQQVLPLDTGNYAGSGLCKAMLGRYCAALDDARSATRLGPTTTEMMFNVACIYSLVAGQVRSDVTRSNRLNLEGEYRTEALARIRSALAMLPAEQRAHFWVTKMRADHALDSIRDSAAFAELDKEYFSPQRKPTSHVEQ